MEKYLTDLHGIETLGLLLALNILTIVGKFLFNLFQKKNDQTDQNHKSLSDKTNHLSEKIEHLDGRMEHLQSVIASYMETTIDFATKLGAVEKQLIGTAERLEEQMDRLLKDIRR